MSKTVELARHLEKLHINNMYKTDFYWTWDKTDDEIDAVFTVADALRDLRERNKSTKIFNSGLGISLFRDNSTRTRFSFASPWRKATVTAFLSSAPRSSTCSAMLTIRRSAWPTCCMSSTTSAALRT